MTRLDTQAGNEKLSSFVSFSKSSHPEAPELIAKPEGRVAVGPVRRVERTSKPNAQLHGLTVYNSPPPPPRNP